MALRFELEPHWHLYWTNPGSNGLPIELEWDLPDGVTAGEIEWQVPKRIPLDIFVNYGYEDEVVYLVPITLPADYAGDSLT